MRGFPFLIISFFVGTLTCVLLSLTRIQRGRRLNFILDNAFEVSMQALLGAFAAFWITVFVGGPICLGIVWAFNIPFESPMKYEILGVSFVIIYLFCFIYALKTNVPMLAKKPKA